MAITNSSPNDVRVTKAVLAIPAIAGESLNHGDLVTIDNTSDGRAKKASAGNAVGVVVSEYRSSAGVIASGEAVTVIRTGIISGLAITSDYGQVIQAAASGAYADANDNDGVNVGIVIAGNTNLVGSDPEKVLWVDVAYTDVDTTG